MGRGEGHWTESEREDREVYCTGPGPAEGAGSRAGVQSDRAPGTGDLAGERN